MTNVGHFIAGATVALMVIPRRTSLKRGLVYLLVFAIAANVPDFRLPNWGHERYSVSHSVFVNLALILPLFILLICWPRARQRIGGTPVIIGCAVAWLSHLLLDSFYNHGHGIAIFWPASSARLALPMPWFYAVHRPWHPLRIVRSMAIEFVFYGAIFTITAIIRRVLTRRTRPRKS